MNRNEELIYSREVQSRIDLLERTTEELDSDDKQELVALLELKEECVRICGGESAWSYGVELIRDTYFTTYAKDYADRMGLVSDINDWPARHIDWEQAVEEFRVDYGSVEWKGVLYYVPR